MLPLVALTTLLCAGSTSALDKRNTGHEPQPALTTGSASSSGPSGSTGSDIPTASIRVDATKKYQEVDGWGSSQAFQRAEDLQGKFGLSPKNISYLLDLIYDVDKGAGFTILRNGIGSSNTSNVNYMNSIQPLDPGGPGKTNYTWDAYASGQYPLAWQARLRGLPYLYADAWSAPGYMKTNNDENNGGYLCGVSNTTCASGDWKQAYADYLVQNWKYYSAGGLNITHLGLFNEPSFAPDYASMQTNGTQAAEIIKVLGQTLEKENIDVKITCCDDYGWDEQEALMEGLQVKGPDGKSGEDYISVVTAHGYASPPTYPLSTSRKVWQTEWADLSGQPRWTPYSFYNASGLGVHEGEGLTWASRIQVAFRDANVSAFLYWIGSENATSNSALITTLGDSVIPSKRFWTFAQFSKFVRPGARRIEASSNTMSLNVTAFQNTNGLVAVQVLNNLTEAYNVQASFGSKGCSWAVPYVTNNDNDLAEWAPIKTAQDGSFTGYVPARSLVSWVQ